MNTLVLVVPVPALIVAIVLLLMLVSFIGGYMYNGHRWEIRHHGRLPKAGVAPFAINRAQPQQQQQKPKQPVKPEDWV